MSVNKVILIGNLGSDPEIHTFQDGNKVANVSLATTEKWSDKQTGERKELTEWHRLVFSNRLAEIAQQYLRKGSKIYAEGSIRTKKYQDKQTGQDRYSTEIRVQQMQMLDSNPNAGQYQGGNQNQGGFQGQQQGQQQPQAQNQGGYQNQNQDQAYQNQGFQNQNTQNQGQQANGFGSPAPQHQAPQHNSAPHQPPANPTAPAMSQAPADDDIPF